MNILIYILIFTFLGSILSLIGGILLLIKENLALKSSHYLSAFAAGTLLGTAFLDLLPEALEQVQEIGLEINIFLATLLGILVFFLLERFIDWFHHHHEHQGQSSSPTVPLIVLGDSLHNFIDGMAIAATFLVSIPLGVVTALAVAAHEIPQEIGDFGILLHKGVSRSKVLWYNVFSALTALLGAMIVFWVGEVIKQYLPVLLSLTAGFFIYIAASDLIPEIHSEDRKDVALMETVLLIMGVLMIWLVMNLL